MAPLATLSTPAGLPADEETERVLGTVGFKRRDDGTYLSDEDQDGWRLVAEFNKQRPTIQVLHLCQGGVVFWHSGYHTGKAFFEYKSSPCGIPSRINMYVPSA